MGGVTVPPAALPGTSIQIIFASSQAITTTSNRFTYGGKTLLAAAPSIFEKLVKCALEIMFNEAIKCVLFGYNVATR